MPRERQLIVLEAFTRSLSYQDLKKMDMLFTLKQKRFDLELIEKNDGIRISRLTGRGIEIKEHKLEQFGIDPVRPFQVRLPGFEDRLSLDDLVKLGYDHQQLKKMGLFKFVEKSRNGAAINLLKKNGLHITNQDLAHAKIDPEKKIFYDIIVIKTISQVRAEFMIVREGDDPQALEKGHGANTLDSIQKYLYENIGIVEMDFSDLLALPPQLNEVKIGDHWIS
jgi:hypothetical protein